MIRYALRNNRSKEYIGFNKVPWEFGVDTHLDYNEDDIFLTSDRTLMDKLIKDRKSLDAALQLSDAVLKDLKDYKIEVIEIDFPDTDWWDD